MAYPYIYTTKYKKAQKTALNEVVKAYLICKDLWYIYKK